MKIIIDRIEENMAIAELPDKTTVAVPKTLFEDVCEGAVYEIIKQDGAIEKNQIKTLMESVWED